MKAAWEKFIVTYRETIYHAAYGIAGSDSVGRELADSLYAELYGLRTGRVSGARHCFFIMAEVRWRDGCAVCWRSDLWTYTAKPTGKSLWMKWRNRLVPQLRRKHLLRPSVAVIVRQIVQQTLEGLPADQRFILSAYYLDGRTLKQIASLLGVHESTVSRLLSRLTASLRKQIVRELRKAGISRREAEEIMEVDVRDLEIQVRKILQGEAATTFQDQRALTVEGGESDV